MAQTGKVLDSLKPLLLMSCIITIIFVQCVLVVLIVAMVEAQLKIAKSPLRRDSASAYAPPYSASQKTAAAAPSYASGPSYAGGRVKIQVRTI